MKTEDQAESKEEASTLLRTHHRPTPPTLPGSLREGPASRGDAGGTCHRRKPPDTVSSTPTSYRGAGGADALQGPGDQQEGVAAGEGEHCRESGPGPASPRASGHGAQTPRTAASLKPPPPTHNPMPCFCVNHTVLVPHEDPSLSTPCCGVCQYPPPRTPHLPGCALNPQFVAGTAHPMNVLERQRSDTY